MVCYSKINNSTYLKATVMMRERIAAASGLKTQFSKERLDICSNRRLLPE